MQLNDLEVKLNNYIKTGDIVIIAGSLPPGVQDDIYKTWIETCHNKSVISVLDTSGFALAHGVKACPYMIKPNLDEFCSLTGKTLTNISEIKNEASKLVSKGISKILVSMGKDGAVLFSENDLTQIKAPAVQIKSTVGAGDAMLAAFVSGMLKSYDDKRTLALAVEVGSNHCQGVL